MPIFIHCLPTNANIYTLFIYTCQYLYIVYLQMPILIHCLSTNVYLHMFFMQCLSTYVFMQCLSIYTSIINTVLHTVYVQCIWSFTCLFTGKKGQYVWTQGRDAEAISKGIYNTYTQRNLRYSQVAPLDMYKEVNTKTNLPAQIEIYSQDGNQYDFLFLAKGGGSANKTFLYQQTKALLNPEKLLKFVSEKVKVSTALIFFL